MYFPVSSLLTEFLILAVVEREDSYGYEISQTVKLVADIKESTLYPILRRLEQSGYLTTYNRQYPGKRRNIEQTFHDALLWRLRGARLDMGSDCAHNAGWGCGKQTAHGTGGEHRGQ